MLQASLCVPADRLFNLISRSPPLEKEREFNSIDPTTHTHTHTDPHKDIQVKMGT